jgi:hypothetical protein
VVPILALILVAQAHEPNDYWQQEVHYTIQAQLDEEAEVLRAGGTMVYHNRSPDALEELYFHLHLNAFRPGSIWSRVERRQSLQFGALEDPDYGYERLHRMRVGDRPLEVTFPHAPDSTVARVDLPDPLEPGDSVVVSFEWDARPATLCRRQCRQGRHYDFAQWYPRIAPYDRYGWQPHPLYPQGEFYGEFGIYDVTLDLAEDQVVGATGVPLEGDPGWRPTGDSPGGDPVDVTGFYAQPRAPVSPDFLPQELAPGRKRVRFYAEDVHHFAWATDPAYMYEGGHLGDVAIHVLFLPGDVEWDLGAVVRKTARALGWLQETLGEYPWPQLTITHRLDTGGTEFPMFIGNGGSSQGLITHETAHQFAHGILANNEWRDAWLDEGMASFLVSWFMEDRGQADPWSATVAGVARREAAGVPVPMDTLSEDMPDFSTYGHLAYDKAEVMYRMLREYLGHDVFGEALRTYYDRNKLQHVTEEDFHSAMAEVSGEDLGWFFDQWVHSTATLDYALGAIEQRQDEAGDWVTEVEVIRRGDAWMPVVVLAGDHVEVVDGSAVTQTVRMVTPERPPFVVLDPWFVLPDTDRDDNWRELPAP